MDRLHIAADTVSTHWTTRLPIRLIRFSTTGYAFDQVVYGVGDEAGRVAEVVGQIGDAVATMGESSTTQCIPEDFSKTFMVCCPPTIRMHAKKTESDGANVDAMKSTSISKPMAEAEEGT